MTETARFHPAGPANADLPAKPIGLLRRLAVVLADDPDVAGFAFAPVTFTWTDGFDGRTRRYTPDLLVERRDASRTFVSTVGRTVLREDSGLDGRRGHVDAECLSVGATFEVWTEREIASTVGDVRSLARTPGGWVGRCGLTGVPMSVLPGALRAGTDGTVRWTPPPERRRPPPAAGTDARAAGVNA